MLKPTDYLHLTLQRLSFGEMFELLNIPWPMWPRSSLPLFSSTSLVLVSILDDDPSSSDDEDVEDLPMPPPPQVPFDDDKASLYSCTFSF
jgi:hypothetical protein